MMQNISLCLSYSKNTLIWDLLLLISAIERAVSYRMLLIPHEFCTLQRIEMEHFSTFRSRLNEATHACVLTSAQLHTHLDELYQKPFAWKIALIKQSQSTLKF